MTDKQKIKILNDRIGILENENEQLESKVKKLEELMYFSSNTEKESAERLELIFEYLNTKMKEYEELVSECNNAKKDYTDSVRNIRRMTSRYKKDIRSTKLKQLVNKIKRELS